MTHPTERDSRPTGDIPNPTAALSQFVSDLTFDRLPVEVVETVKLLLLDNVGCMFAGSRTGLAASLSSYFESLGGAPQATVIGSCLRLPAPQ